MTVRHTSFPKTSRLKLASDFRDLLKSGKSYRENGLILYFKASKTNESRLGIVVSKRVLKRAVDRNQFKRFVREYYRKEKVNFNNSADIIVRALENRDLLKPYNLQICLNSLFKKAKLVS